MDAIQEDIAAWLPENVIEQLRSQKSAAAPNTQPWVLEVSRPCYFYSFQEQ